MSFRKQPKNFKVCFVLFWIFTVLRAACFLTVAIGALLYLFDSVSESSVSAATIGALLADFLFLLAILIVNSKTHILTKRTRLLLLFSPVLLFGVMALSVVSPVLEIGSSEYVAVESASWALMAAYFLPGLAFLIVDSVRYMRSDPFSQPLWERSLSERIRGSKK